MSRRKPGGPTRVKGGRTRGRRPPMPKTCKPSHWKWDAELHEWRHRATPEAIALAEENAADRERRGRGYER